MTSVESTPHPIRLLLVDDTEIFLLGLQTLFSRVPSIRVVGQASTAATARSEALRLTPDVILMDLRLPDGTGVESCREIRALCPNTKVLFLSSNQDDEALLAATFAGASGYLLKQIDHVALIVAVEAVAKGQSVLDPHMTAAVLDRMRSLSTASAKGASVALSPNRNGCWRCWPKGKPTKKSPRPSRCQTKRSRTMSTTSSKRFT